MNRPLILVGVAIFPISARVQTTAPNLLVFSKTDAACQDMIKHNFEPDAYA